MLSVEDVPDHRPEGNAHLHGSLDQLQSYLGLGAKLRIRLATLEMVCRSIRLHLDGVVDSLVHPQARNRDDTIVYLADPTQVLLSDMCGSSSILAVPGLVHDESAACLRSDPRVFEHNLHPAPVQLLRTPTRL